MWMAAGLRNLHRNTDPRKKGVETGERKQVRQWLQYTEWNLACDPGTEFGTELYRSGENGKRGTVGKTVGGELRSLSPVSLDRRL